MACLFILACGSAKAASLAIVANGSTPYTYSVYLNGTGVNGNFNTIKLDARPRLVLVQLSDSMGRVVADLVAPFSLGQPSPPGYAFANLSSGQVAGVPRPAGEAFTYYNRLLNADPLDAPGGKGWSLLGIKVTEDLVGFSGGPLGANITTANEPNGQLFLANLYYVPEPAACGLVGMALLGLVALRRRRA
jgi:hypothetical protein